MHALVTGVSAAGGLVLGSELEILVERMGARRPLDRPLWRCAECARPFRGWELVPLVRPWAGRAPCPTCGTAPVHPWRPLVMGVVSALVLGAFAVRLGDDVVLAPFALLGLGLVAISAVDLERHIIPNRLVYPMLALLSVLLVVASGVDHDWHALVSSAVAGAVCFAIFYVINLVYAQGMGFGDVRLAGVIGVATGWLGYGRTFVGFFAAFLLGAVIGVAAIALSGAGRKTRIPFGPFLAAGAVVTVVWGGPVAHALFHRSA